MASSTTSWLAEILRSLATESIRSHCSGGDADVLLDGLNHGRSSSVGPGSGPGIVSKRAYRLLIYVMSHST